MALPVRLSQSAVTFGDPPFEEDPPESQPIRAKQRRSERLREQVRRNECIKIVGLWNWKEQKTTRL
jgi:hypothetical protein